MIWLTQGFSSIGAIAILTGEIYIFVVMLNDASSGHHMLEFRGDHQALTVNAKNEYDYQGRLTGSDLHR